MIINMVGGGGGAALNFKVVPGLTQPGTASENTIWVKAERIGVWYFSATQPDGMQEWDVWFPTGTESTVEFNAIKKNAVQVYPLSSKQMVGGELVAVEAMSYQGGEWVDWWDGSLLSPVDEWEHITGGWVADKNFQRVESHTNMVAPTVTKDSGSITLTMRNNSYGGSYHTQNKVDVSRFKTLKIDIESATCGNGYLLFFLQDTLGNNVYHNSAASAQILGDNKTSFQGTCSINVESITGEFYIGLSLTTYNSGAMTVKFAKIYLE